MSYTVIIVIVRGYSQRIRLLKTNVSNSFKTYKKMIMPENYIRNRIPTVKLKIKGKSMGKSGYRTSVKFKL